MFDRRTHIFLLLVIIGLLAHLEIAITRELAGGSYDGVHGALVFSDADGEAMDNVSQI